MPRIDSHVHAFPDRLALAVRAHFDRDGSGFDAPGGPRLTGGVLLEDVAYHVQQSGFDAAWMLPYAHRASVAEGVNEWSAREAPRYPWLIPGATFHPADAEFARLVERALVELRLRIVKLHCAVGQFSPGDPRLGPLWRIAAERSVPIVIHAGQRSPGDTAGDEVEELAPVLAAWPELRVVLAHSGHTATKRTLDLMARFDNLYGDLTPVWDRFVDLTAEDIRRFPGRFLFGSDAPNSPLPSAAHIAHVERLGLTPPELALVMGDAAESLISLDL